MKYRAEIDGLRAVAVIPVILFHAGFEQFGGGFVGVDIFFVISGYLITTIILSEKERNTFSLVNFYDRRARRILPALFLVMFISLPFAWFWLFPSDMKDFSQSLVAVSTFSSNILFWQETGYWGVDNELKPLLHTWSLAVEEQYYILFPLFIMAMWKLKKRWIFGSFIILAILSFLISEWGAYKFPTANFFLLPTRAWELAIGASISFIFLYNSQAVQIILSRKIINEVLGFFGLILISYSVFVFNEATPFPGTFALIPTVGTGLIILFSSKETIVGKLLGSRLPVSIGLISYSAYLWHQPIFAFSRHRSLIEPNGVSFALLTLLTFILAYISWKYVEKPFRTKNQVSSYKLAIFGFSGSVIFITIGLAGHFSNGFNGYYNENRLTQEYIEEKLKVNHGLSRDCDGVSSFLPECKTSAEPEILIWGDSHAMHLVQGVLASNPNAKVVQITKSVCGPFFGVAPITPKYSVSWAQDCLQFTEDVLELLEGNNSIKYAVVSSPFYQYLYAENKLLYPNGNIESANVNSMKIHLVKTLDKLKAMGIAPVVFSPPPANGMDLGRCLAKAEWNGLDLDNCNFVRSDMSKARKEVYQLLEKIEKSYRVVRLDDFICQNDVCKTHFDDVWIYRDKGHLSYEGSIKLGKRHDFYKLITEGER